MSPERDWEGEMKRFGLDDDTADRLLSGQIAPQDAPPGYQAVAEAVLAARATAPVDAGRETATVAAMVEALRSGSQPQTPVRRERMLARLLSAKVAAIATVTVLGATAAAAATNELPDAAQGFVSHAAAHVGLHVPKPDKHAHGANQANKPATPGNGAAVGPDASGPAKFGLCTAYASGKATTNPHSHKKSAVAFANLQAAATDAGMSVADYCAATPPTTDTTTTTTTTTAPGTADTTQSGNGTPPTSTPVGPPVSTPVGGGSSHGHPPVSTPVGPPVSTPVGPPVSTPVGPPVNANGHPPVSTPVGPPTSNPGNPHRP